MRRRAGKDEPPGPDRNRSRHWYGEKRTNQTHASPHRPAATLCRKAHEHPTKLYYMGQLLMDHREVLAVDVEVSERGITVNPMAPGIIATPLFEAAAIAGLPEEVAALVAFPATEEASYVTAQTSR
jgi:hypothetical protein